MQSHPYKVTTTYLADGRELLYFDDTEPYLTGGALRKLKDDRQLSATSNFSEMRKDPLSGKWVVYAAHRMQRTFMPPANENPLAPTVPGQLPTEIPADDYDIAVFENRFPSFSLNAALDDSTLNLPTSAPAVPRLPAQARCEVVCFTSDATKSFRDLTPHRVRTVIEVWAHRTEALSKIDGVESVYPFENRGVEIGVTLQHPHGQIYSYPFIPPQLESMIEQCRGYFAWHGRDLFDDLLRAEHELEVRIVTRGTHFTTLVPPAAKWPLEVMIIPHRKVRDFTDLSNEEKDELAVLYLDLLQRVDQFYPGVDKTPYIAAWNQTPANVASHEMRFHLNLFSLMRAPHRMKYLAGSESGMGVWINDTTPERIAARLREVS
ncbi:galactose-1-phosphate uridylyltransferase [Corynebacterium sp.]|uniref:galactose-1-phosphate uridylyltransferase n=1 Tax=Corynebacterium sp. TaxID=1720 RepID=UPI0026DF7C23|nr:galactose-1-phosphate uridylyltransferase [Corynebacterium sp.]MDO5512140.1 galactose-1-phosphate uridylyltransferase [Corynebacterium sp.]